MTIEHIEARARASNSTGHDTLTVREFSPTDSSDVVIARLADLGDAAVAQRLAPGAGLDPAMLVNLELRRGRDVIVLLVERDAQFVAGAAVSVPRRTALPGSRTITLAGTDVLDRAALWFDDAKGDDATVRTLAHGIVDVARSRGNASLHLDQLPDDHRLLAALTEATALHEVEEGQCVPLIVWDDAATWTGKKTRNKYRAGVRRLDNSEHAWQIDCLASRAAIEDALPETLVLRRERELALGRADGFAEAAVRDLHLARVAALADHDEAQLWRLVIDGTLVAYAIAGLDGERVEMLDSRIAPGHEALAPGMVLFGAMTHAWFHRGFEPVDGPFDTTVTLAGASAETPSHIATPVRVVDFGRGLTTFKRQFHTMDEQHVTLHAWPGRRSRVISRALDTASRTARTPLRFARDHSTFANALAHRARLAQMRRRHRLSEGGEHGSNASE